jgi:hypothetical protein
MSEEGEVEFDGEITEALRGRTLIRTALGSAPPIRMRGAMLWFNVEQDVGALRTDDGERLDIPGTAFSSGEKPVGRCAGKAVDFEYVDGAVSELVFVPEVSQRRARMRHSR